MPAANFVFQKDFPLYVKKEDDFLNEDGEVDEILFQEWYADFDVALRNFNKEIKFFEISLVAGYYSDWQLYVQDMSEDVIPDTAFFEEVDRDSLEYEYILEKRSLAKYLEVLASDFNFTKLKSLGGGFYQEIPIRKKRGD